MSRTWDDIIAEQKKIQGEVVHNLINEVSILTENMSAYELDLLEE